MQEKPKIKLVLSTGDKLFEVLGWLLLPIPWFLLLNYYPGLPATIAIHYDGSGKADSFGGKTAILILPILASLIFIGLSILNRFPHTFNYPASIHPENAEGQYKNATRFIRYLKFIIVLLFGYINLKTMQIARNEAEELGVWFLPIFLGLVFIPLIYFIIRSIKMKA